MPLTKEVKQGLIKKHQAHDKDAGSSDVQIAILTERIRGLTDHLAKHKKDHATRRGLLMLVSRRSTLLKYVQRRSPERYQKLIQELGIRK